MAETGSHQGQVGTAEAVAMPEGGAFHQGPAAGGAQLDSMQTLPAEPSSSPGVALPSFDLLASLGEAEQLILSLKGFADLIPDPRWQAISKGLDVIIAAHNDLNKPSAR